MAGGIAGIEHDEAGIVDPAVGINEASMELRLHRLAGRVAAEVDPGAAGQRAASRQVVVEEQPGADHPGRAQVLVVRQHEAQRPDYMRRAVQQDLALQQRLAH